MAVTRRPSNIASVSRCNGKQPPWPRLYCSFIACSKNSMHVTRSEGMSSHRMYHVRTCNSKPNAKADHFWTRGAFGYKTASIITLAQIEAWWTAHKYLCVKVNSFPHEQGQHCWQWPVCIHLTTQRSCTLCWTVQGEFCLIDVSLFKKFGPAFMDLDTTHTKTHQTNCANHFRVKNTCSTARQCALMRLGSNNHPNDLVVENVNSPYMTFLVCPRFVLWVCVSKSHVDVMIEHEQFALKNHVNNASQVPVHAYIHNTAIKIIDIMRHCTTQPLVMQIRDQQVCKRMRRVTYSPDMYCFCACVHPAWQH